MKTRKVRKWRAKDKIKKHVMYRMLETLERGSVVARYMNNEYDDVSVYPCEPIMSTYYYLFNTSSFIFVVKYRIERFEKKKKKIQTVRYLIAFGQRL